MPLRPRLRGPAGCRSEVKEGARRAGGHERRHPAGPRSLPKPQREMDAYSLSPHSLINHHRPAGVSLGAPARQGGLTGVEAGLVAEL